MNSHQNPIVLLIKQLIMQQYNYQDLEEIRECVQERLYAIEEKEALIETNS